MTRNERFVIKAARAFASEFDALHRDKIANTDALALFDQLLSAIQGERDAWTALVGPGWECATCGEAIAGTGHFHKQHQGSFHTRCRPWIPKT